MVNPQVGFQPRTTPAERRAFFDTQRKLAATGAATYTQAEVDALLDTLEAADTTLAAADTALDTRLDTLEASAISGPLGVVAFAQVTANQGSITTAVDLTGLSVTFTAAPARYYRVTGRGWISSTVATDLVYLPIATGAGVQLQNAAGVANGVSLFNVAVLNSLSGSTTLKLQMGRASGTGTITNLANANTPSFILVEDLGIL